LFVLGVEGGLSEGDAGWGLLKQEASLKLNGLAKEFEVKLAKGDVEFNIVDKLSVVVEFGAGKLSTDSKSLDLDLMTITVKLVGDWSDLAKKATGLSDIKVTVDGRIEGSVGKALLKKHLANLAKSHADEALKATQLDKHLDDLQNLHRENAKVGGD
jgi:hypothetical protein